MSVTYALDPGDTDLTALAEEKAGEVQRAHEAAWNRIGALGTRRQRRPAPAGPAVPASEEDDGRETTSRKTARRTPGCRPISRLPTPPAGAWYLPGASRPSGETGKPGPDLQPDAEPVTGPQKILIRSRAGKIGLSTYALERLLYQQFKVWRVERLTKAQAASLLDALDRDLKEKDARTNRTSQGKERNPRLPRHYRQQAVLA